ncbi:MAG: SiaB family protein kinase, partial [Campylobacterota bacterium]|nr:SiaB family protein kinase [Campylobacterota bacterium]
MIESYYSFQQQLEREGIMFSFVGPVSHNVVEGVGTVLRNKLELEAVSTNVSLKVFSIFVEQIQNVIRYSADRIPQDDFESEISFGMLIVGEKDDQYFLIGGNRVTVEQKERLDSFLAKLA